MGPDGSASFHHFLFGFRQQGLTPGLHAGSGLVGRQPRRKRPV